MYRVGLSGGRYSGKDRISKLFKQVLVPVFNADALLKFILNWDHKLLGEVKIKLGKDYFYNGTLNFDKLKNSNSFEKVLDFVEPVILENYSKFEKKHSNSIYTIFHYSLLFERGLHHKMNKNISVFAPDLIRTNRAIQLTNETYLNLTTLLRKEMNTLEKNKMSDYTIHNYEYGDVYDSVSEIDKQIVDDYLKNKTTQKIQVINKNFIKIK
jgi:dephospho-CoA kinase